MHHSYTQKQKISQRSCKCGLPAGPLVPGLCPCRWPRGSSQPCLPSAKPVRRSRPRRTPTAPLALGPWLWVPFTVWPRPPSPHTVLILWAHRTPDLWPLSKPAQPLGGSPQPHPRLPNSHHPPDLVLGPRPWQSCPEQKPCLLPRSSHGPPKSALYQRSCTSYWTVSLQGREHFFFVSSVSLPHLLESLGLAQTLSQSVCTLFSFLNPSSQPASSTSSLPSHPIAGPSINQEVLCYA